MRLVNACSTPRKRDVCLNLYYMCIDRGCIIFAVRVKKKTALTYRILTISTLSSKGFHVFILLARWREQENKNATEGGTRALE